ncbi:MAG TPA: Pr6Pr family membrane protein [Mycobacteriales bacterium]|nr:Pr6Pr family membrane protein [Mycobacteriales bacterium]
MGSPVLRVVRVGIAVAGAAALVTALVTSTGSAANFFSFFTVQSNVLAVVVLLVSGVADPRSERWAFVRGAVTLYLVITGIVYAALLSDVDVQLAAPWTDSVLHRIVPIMMLVDWLLLPPWTRASRARALTWLAFPLAYFAYSLLRGPIADWYPYPFLDPRPHGYDHVLGYAVVLALGMALLALAVRRIAAQRLAAGEHDVEADPRPRAR